MTDLKIQRHHASPPATLFAEPAGHSKDSIFVDVALGVPQEEPYQYSVPVEFKDQVHIGRRVWVPLRAQMRIGYIVGISPGPQVKNVKPIREIIDSQSYLSEPLLDLTQWMSQYYFCSWGQAIESAMPAPFKKGKTTMKSRVKANPDESLIHATPACTLTEDQEMVFQTISGALDKRQFANFLLHGVTGSGKTEIYLRLIEKLIQEDYGSIVLVPEISLTPQTTHRFKARFGDQVAVVHSRISAGKRLEEWHRLRNGEAKVVIGARSAVFSPMRSLGLIVIDEEHDDSYKQDETPRYEAGLVADRRCRLENAVLLKASATPSLESFFKATGTHDTQLVSLPERIEKRPLPEVDIIDMRQERAGRTVRIFSVALENAIQKALDQKEQVMLLMNRRGFAPFVNCMTCGFVMSCPRCRVSLVFHHDLGKLLCHICHHSKVSPKMCPACDKGYIRFFGIGTEKVESEAARLFPYARITRMDRDATTRKDSHEKILECFRKQEIDILLGTQMIAKGHDFPGVSVIGVISADTALDLPDFRSAERTFDLLTQVAGRAGRKDIPGRVFIQTFLPQHYAIMASKKHDYLSFYNLEACCEE